MAGTGAGTDTGADFDTVILAGGAAVRMGRADKPGLPVGGTPMVVTVARAAVAAGTRRLIVVGPERGGASGAGLRAAGARLVREEPPGAGPVPALRRGLAEVTAMWLLLLAADLPFLTGGWLAELLARAQAGGPDQPGPACDDRHVAGSAARHVAAPGAVLMDPDGRLQWLAGCWQAGALRTALAGYPGSSLRGLLAPMWPVPVRLELPAADAGRAPWLDCDTPADLAAARHAAAGPGPDQGELS